MLALVCRVVSRRDWQPVLCLLTALHAAVVPSLYAAQGAPAVPWRTAVQASQEPQPAVVPQRCGHCGTVCTAAGHKRPAPDTPAPAVADDAPMKQARASADAVAAAVSAAAAQPTAVPGAPAAGPPVVLPAWYTFSDTLVRKCNSNPYCHAKFARLHYELTRPERCHEPPPGQPWQPCAAAFVQITRDWFKMQGRHHTEMDLQRRLVSGMADLAQHKVCTQRRAGDMHMHAHACTAVLGRQIP